MKIEINQGELPKTGFLRLNQVLKLIPVSRSTWCAGVKAGRFPNRVRISQRVVAWRAEDLRAFIDGTWKPEIPKTDSEASR